MHPIMRDRDRLELSTENVVTYLSTMTLSHGERPSTAPASTHRPTIPTPAGLTQHHHVWVEHTFPDNVTLRWEPAAPAQRAR